MSYTLFPSVSVVLVAIVTLALAAEPPSKCTFTQKDSTFSQFFPLSEVQNSQPDGFYAKIKVSVTSDYGDVHILLAETDDFEGANQGYEFVSEPRRSAEIRRKSSVYGKYEVLTKTNTSVEDYAPSITTFEFSVSRDGMIKVSVLSPNSTIATYDNNYLFDINKYRVLSSNYSLETKDSNNFPVNFITFSGHSKLQFNCDYGVFRDKTLFVQTRCEGIYGWRQEELFHAIESTDEFHPEGYYAKVDISMISDYGDLHVILSESDVKDGPNQNYEIVIADRFGTTSEIRRKNSISEEIDFVDRSTFAYNLKGQRASIWMQISVSVDGVVSFNDPHRNVTVDFKDTKSTIPVKYITFGGIRKWPATYEIDCIKNVKCSL